MSTANADRPQQRWTRQLLSEAPWFLAPHNAEARQPPVSIGSISPHSVLRSAPNPLVETYTHPGGALERGYRVPNPRIIFGLSQIKKLELASGLPRPLRRAHAQFLFSFSGLRETAKTAKIIAIADIFSRFLRSKRLQDTQDKSFTALWYYTRLHCLTVYNLFDL